ncbi:MAG: hypothetical protein PHQ52_02265 [Candidatus Omnitrophica bacterium]|nr:hypothetical protein [Candidatus Omnitrophota bacterium]
MVDNSFWCDSIFRAELKDVQGKSKKVKGKSEERPGLSHELRAVRSNVSWVMCIVSAVEGPGLSHELVEGSE